MKALMTDMERALTQSVIVGLERRNERLREEIKLLKSQLRVAQLREVKRMANARTLPALLRRQAE